MITTSETDQGRLVAEAMTMLDEELPGWWSVDHRSADGEDRSIVLPTLDMDQIDRCVLGQLYGDWCEAPRHLRRHEAFAGDYESVEDAWIAAIAIRRAGAAL